ncbi:amino acid permease [Gordonia sp. (in: high G+C Gram-positive bacteria)]|uniref:amino acid permease n=1 Tax=Gordonia sp. (in: high G+C Gram-positive bacteria) TaxID=84139 RepID=UPI0025B804D8|nr:amino acid permease [Gordonia sp. (in: high G+C Gram-positive bacteria)]
MGNSESEPIEVVDERRLKGGLKPRHLVMMSLGSAIGAGLFVGSGQGIALAGPAALVAYAVIGLIIVSVMRMLGELAASDPNPGAFSHYVGNALGPGAGFMMGWLWWIQMTIVVAAEALAAATTLQELVGVLPAWGWSLIFMIVFTLLNLSGVSNFGELEFWFSLIKIIFIVVFLVIGAAYLFGWTSEPSPGLSNPGEFLPNGVGGIAAALLVIAFAFGGIEIIAIAAAETADPGPSVTKAIRTIVWRILIFYVGSVAIIMLVLPAGDPRIVESPFVGVLEQIGLPAVATTLGIVIVVALLSSLNVNLYGASRMLYSLSDRGMAPKIGTRTQANGVPVAAVLASIVVGFLMVPATYVWGDQVLERLLAMVGSTLLVTWIAIAAAQLVLRRRADRNDTHMPMKMWGYPYLTNLTLLALAGIVVLGLTTESVRGQVLSTAALVVVLWGIGAYLARRNSPTADPTPDVR